MDPPTTYIAVMVDWVTKHWEHRTLCIDVAELPAPKDTDAHERLFRAALHHVGIMDEQMGLAVIAGLSDHEGTVRAALRPPHTPETAALAEPGGLDRPAGPPRAQGEPEVIHLGRLGAGCSAPEKFLGGNKESPEGRNFGGLEISQVVPISFK